MKKDTCFFISDAHFGLPIPGGEGREQLFNEFVSSVAGRMETLIILGDFFDFWIEYNSVIRLDYFSLLCKLKQLVDSGVAVHYLAGNHDFALGPFFKNQLGITVHLNTFDTEIQGNKVFMYHGDGLINDDVGYRILKKILRNPLNQKIYKALIHPDLGVWIGTLASNTSKKHNKERYLSPERISEYRSCAQKKLRDGYDIVFFGHTHAAEHLIFPEGIYCNTGAWLTKYTFASMQAGEVRLFEYLPGGNFQLLEPSFLK
ncbi:MAG TPA: UDP-2,3-diacylglucosamine diphosphatase [Chitinispirillaceae bacterium]|nr:UDP-2,3-diacylglucosamine diphosphatase [Chitinispirillaceae bacterium]